VPFHEYFHGDNGAGVGASHQTGWTGLIAKLIQQQGEHAGRAGEIDAAIVEIGDERFDTVSQSRISNLESHICEKDRVP
jgi:hypothetical protein